MRDKTQQIDVEIKFLGQQGNKLLYCLYLKFDNLEEAQEVYGKLDGCQGKLFVNGENIVAVFESKIHGLLDFMFKSTDVRLRYITEHPITHVSVIQAENLKSPYIPEPIALVQPPQE